MFDLFLDNFFCLLYKEALFYLADKEVCGEGFDLGDYLDSGNEVG